MIVGCVVGDRLAAILEFVTKIAAKQNASERNSRGSFPRIPSAGSRALCGPGSGGKSVQFGHDHGGRGLAQGVTSDVAFINGPAINSPSFMDQVLNLVKTLSVKDRELNGHPFMLNSPPIAALYESKRVVVGSLFALAFLHSFDASESVCNLTPSTGLFSGFESIVTKA